MPKRSVFKITSGLKQPRPGSFVGSERKSKKKKPRKGILSRFCIDFHRDVVKGRSFKMDELYPRKNQKRKLPFRAGSFAIVYTKTKILMGRVKSKGEFEVTHERVISEVSTNTFERLLKPKIIPVEKIGYVEEIRIISGRK